MTMILRVPFTGRSTRVIHYTNTVIWCRHFNHLYNDQLTSVTRAHGSDCDHNGWAEYRVNL